MVIYYFMSCLFYSVSLSASLLAWCYLCFSFKNVDPLSHSSSSPLHLFSVIYGFAVSNYDFTSSSTSAMVSTALASFQLAFFLSKFSFSIVSHLHPFVGSFMTPNFNQQGYTDCTLVLSFYNSPRIGCQQRAPSRTRLIRLLPTISVLCLITFLGSVLDLTISLRSSSLWFHITTLTHNLPTSCSVLTLCPLLVSFTGYLILSCLWPTV